MEKGVGGQNMPPKEFDTAFNATLYALQFQYLIYLN